MLLRIYATGDRVGSRGCGPSLIVDADRTAALPGHPAGKTWLYFATVSNRDRLIASRRPVIEAALAGHGFFASQWGPGTDPAPSYAPPPRHRRIETHHHGRSAERQRAELAFHLPA